MTVVKINGSIYVLNLFLFSLQLAAVINTFKVFYDHVACPIVHLIFTGLLKLPYVPPMIVYTYSVVFDFRCSPSLRLSTCGLLGA